MEAASIIPPSLKKSTILLPAIFRYFITLHSAVSAAVPYFCHSGLSSHLSDSPEARIFLAFRNKSEGFSMRVFAESRYDPTSGNDTENKYSISDALLSLPQGSSFENLLSPSPLPPPPEGGGWGRGNILIFFFSFSLSHIDSNRGSHE